MTLTAAVLTTTVHFLKDYCYLPATIFWVTFVSGAHLFCDTLLI
jgi:hypothetical protein